MDEPTNDLDVETLELLEELLGDYPGTLLLVSHDRDFLDNVVTSTMVMQDGAPGRVGEYVGGYTDWLRQRSQPTTPITKSTSSAKPAATPVRTPERKRSYKEMRELELLPARIETLESTLATLAADMTKPAFYQQDGAAITAHGQLIADAQAELDAAYARWSALEP
jgi:ATP-binding cassette subfamily F protein uup